LARHRRSSFHVAKRAGLRHLRADAVVPSMHASFPLLSLAFKEFSSKGLAATAAMVFAWRTHSEAVAS